MINEPIDELTNRLINEFLQGRLQSRANPKPENPKPETTNFFGGQVKTHGRASQQAR